MTRMIDALAARPGPQRILIALLLAGISLFLLGVSVGLVAAILEKGWPSRPFVPLIPVIAFPLGIFGAWVAWRLIAPPATASAYEKRYWRMWILVAALGMPVGAALAISTRFDDLTSLNPFASTPISALTAILLAVLATGSVAVALYLYHRTIDDHEERAYLWGSQIAYYFLILALPAWWLLDRGGIVGPVTTAVALVAILISFLVQAVVWAWLKFR